MSSQRLGLAAMLPSTDSDEPLEWTSVKPPTAEQDMPSAAGVIHALAHIRFANCADGPAFDLDAATDYGSGDPELSRDVEAAIDRHWND